MMKLFLILLIVTSCYHSSAARDYEDLSLELIDNSPFIQGLINYGGQVVAGQAGDSGLLVESYLSYIYPQTYSASINEEKTLNITADVLISFNYNSMTNLHSIFLVNFNPSTNTRKLLSYSYEWQNNSLNSISGFNISYQADQDSYEVIPFDGLEELTTYKTQDLSNITTSYSSSQDFRENFSNWTSINASAIYDNQTLQYGLNTALRTLRSWNMQGGLINPEYDELNVTKMHSIDTFSAPETADVFRYDFDLKTSNQSGRIVCVIYCPVYSQRYPPYWPPYYPQLPLSVSNNFIISNSDSEAIGANQYYFEEGSYEEEGYYEEEEEYSAEESTESTQEATETNDTNSTTNATSSTSTSTPVIQWYNFNCLYAEMRYYWFVKFTGSD